MGNAEKAALKRFGRGIIGLALSEIVALLTGKPVFIALAPVINAVAKWLRDKFKLINIPV